MQISSLRPRLRPGPKNPDNARPKTTRPTTRPFGWRAAFVMVLIGSGMGLVTLERINHRWAGLPIVGMIPPAAAELSGDALRTTAAGWVPRHIALERSFDKWCRRINTPDCAAADQKLLVTSGAFLEEFEQERAAFIAGLKSISIENASLAGAKHQHSNLAGAVFRGVDLSNANFDGAILEAARFSGVNLGGARFQSADLRDAVVMGHAADPIDFHLANLQGAFVKLDDGAQVNFQGADLTDAWLLGTVIADFRQAKMDRVSLHGVFTAEFGRFQANSDGASPAVFNLALKNSVVSFPKDFFDERALWVPFSWRDKDEPSQDFSHFRLGGTAIRNAHFKGVETWGETAEDIAAHWEIVLRNSFGNRDKIMLPPEATAPCQWVSLPDDSYLFFATWRAWLERGNQTWPPFDSLRSTDRRMTVNGQIQKQVIADIPADDSLLPPKSECDWVTEG